MNDRVDASRAHCARTGRLHGLLSAALGLVAASGMANESAAQDRPPTAGRVDSSTPAIERDLAARIAVLEARLREIEANRVHVADSLAKVPRPPILNAGPQGFTFRSADDQFQLRFRGYLQSDGRIFVNDVARPAVGTFVMRRVRPIFEATIYRFLDIKIMPDFGGGTTAIYDAYADVRLAPGFALRSGKFKPPIGLERLQSANDLAFVERSHPTNLVPNRDIGTELYGDLFGGAFSYAVGVFNGVPDLGFGDGDNGNNKDLVGRVFVQPFKTGPVVALREIGVGVSGSRGTQRGTVTAPFLQTYKSPAQQSIFGFRSDGTVAGTTIADGLHTRIEPQGYYYGGPVGVMWEYVKSSQVVRRGTTLGRLDNQAWQLTTTLTLTGENQTFRGVTPDHPLDPAHRQWGAVELTARYTRMLVDRGAFPVFANLSSQIRDANTWGLGLNWYLSRGVRLADYNDTRYVGGATTGDRERERSIMTRLQHSF